MDAGAARNPGSVMGRTLRIDCHAHVFTRACRLAADRRYTPSREAPLADYLAVIERHGMSHGTLVQPSFLGNDNSYLLASLMAAPGRLRGIAVVEPDVSDAELDRMAAAGVVGIRLNLIGLDDPAEAARHCDRSLLGRLVERGWHVEIQARGRVMATALDRVLASGIRVVVDHFGLPEQVLDHENIGFRTLLALSGYPALWVKLSAPYRFAPESGPFAEALVDTFGGARLLWGSDWPWTRHEAGREYGACLAWLDAWVPDQAARATILGASAARLYGISDQ